MNVRTTAALAFSALALACGGEKPASSGADGGAPPARAEDSRPFVAFPAAGVPNSNPDTVPDPGMVRERGIGVLGFDPGPQLGGRVADTLDVYADTTATAPVVARMVLDTTGVHRFEAREGLVERPGALDYGYEEVGLAVLEQRPDGWLHLFLGYAPGGAVASGWARARPGVLAVTLWENVLPGMPLFFALPPDSIRFYASENGPEQPFAVGSDYIMWPLTVSGDWMRVRAVSPSNYCFTPPAPREDTLWIRWRGEGGRPRVWFFTRGC